MWYLAAMTRALLTAPVVAVAQTESRLSVTRASRWLRPWITAVPTSRAPAGCRGRPPLLDGAALQGGVAEHIGQ